MNDVTDAGATFRQRLDGVAADIERLLDRLLDDAPLAEERARPQRLMDAMRYVSLGGGKRLRPFLVVETAALFKAPRERALMAGAALEFVHCYSLAHDDLPAMDNDDLRRGRPTAHKAFDEATAILAGDGLLTLAFDMLARPETHPNPAVRVALVLALARGAGLGGMVGGQMLDLAAEGRFDGGKVQKLGATDVKLLADDEDRRAACASAASRARSSARRRAAQREALDRYGTLLGEAFQIADDLLDVEGDAATVGKATGKDAAAGKGTFVSVLGLDGAKARLKDLVTEAEAALAPFGRDADVLKMAARFVAERKA